MSGQQLQFVKLTTLRNHIYSGRLYFAVVVSPPLPMKASICRDRIFSLCEWTRWFFQN